MSLHNVLLNNYIKETYNSTVDSISKIYILAESVIGINRLLVLLNVKVIYKILLLGCTFMMNVVTFYLVFTENPQNLSNVVLIFNCLQYFLCNILAAIFCSNLKRLYKDMFDYDEEIKSKYRFNLVSKSNLVQLFIKISFVVILFILSHEVKGLRKLSFAMIPIYFSNTIELHYYRHLFNLFATRIKSIRILLLSSFPMNNEVNTISDDESFKCGRKKTYKSLESSLKVKIKSLLHLYYKIIKMYDVFNEAIKWQLLIIFTTTLITVLGMTYHSALSFIDNKYSWNNAISEIGLIAVRILPLIECCTGGDKISAEVLILRSSLSTRLYNNMFDKTDRRFANSLLVLTEARGLSFSVFRMIEVNSSLPFKLLELVITYLVILLQFYKVINLDHSDN